MILCRVVSSLLMLFGKVAGLSSPVIIVNMIEIIIPGRGTVFLKHLVMDVNGTLAVDGRLLDGVAPRLASLRSKLQLHLITANTHGGQDLLDKQLNLVSVKIKPGGEANQKADFVRLLGPESVIAIGQGSNDALMLQEAAIGLCVLSLEGLATEALKAADLLLPDILSALDALENPMRLIASLRK
jgi:soluble P-type ATPase